MKSRSSLPALAATFLLHLGIIAAIVFGLPDSTQKSPQQEPVTIALLQPAAPAPTPPSPTPATAVPYSEKRHTEKTPQAGRKPERPSRDTVPAPQARADTTTDTKQPAPAIASMSPASPSATQAGTPAAITPAPARTSVTDAAYASTNRKPPYPRVSRSNEEEGIVILRVLVNADGTAGAVEVKTSSGHLRLDEAARSTVQTWRFSPATVDGKPVAEWYQVAIPFTLQGS